MITILLRSGLVGVVQPCVEEWYGPDGVKRRYYLTAFEYCIPHALEVSQRSTLALHPMLADCVDAHDQTEPPAVVYPLPEENDLVTELAKAA